jgi:hypothetical protein
MSGERSNWYIAEVVLRYREQPDSGDLVHVNGILISASSDAEAYEKSQLFGKSHERDYTNTDGHTVTVLFAGLRNLFYIYDGLYDGAELMYEELPDLAPEQVEALVKPKEELAVFAATPGAEVPR